ncbi:MAG: hypothetical protein M1829_006738 [Trizodia sp. TS-e1964]|nr:MAG: hypothetical protein M1829_006738 [Trizodia sp. TS-e1964]
MGHYVPQVQADAANFTLFVVLFFSTAARLGSRWYIARQFGLEDLYIVIALAFYFAYIVILHNEFLGTDQLYSFVISEPEGMQDLQTLDQLSLWSYTIRLMMFDNTTQMVVVAFAKLSLLSIYRRITAARRSHTIILHCVEAFVVCTLLAQAIPVFFTTTPVACSWDFVPYMDPGACTYNINIYHLIMAGSGLNIISDLCCVILPWFVIPKLQISRANKLKLVAMYSLGFINIACSAVRIDAINIEGQNMVNTLESQFKFNFSSVIEATSAILCVNIPGIFAAINRFRQIKKIKSGNLEIAQSGDSDRPATFGGSRGKRIANDTEKSDGTITLTREYTVSDLESGGGSRKGSTDPI